MSSTRSMRGGIIFRDTEDTVPTPVLRMSCNSFGLLALQWGAQAGSTLDDASLLQSVFVQ